MDLEASLGDIITNGSQRLLQNTGKSRDDTCTKSTELELDNKVDHDHEEDEADDEDIITSVASIKRFSANQRKRPPIESLDEYGFVEDSHTSSPLKTFNKKSQYFAGRTKMNDCRAFNVGDLEQYRVKYGNGRTEKLWFSKETNTIRRLFSTINVSNLSNVNSETETFRARFTITFTWIPTKKQFKILYYMANRLTNPNFRVFNPTTVITNFASDDINLCLLSDDEELTEDELHRKFQNMSQPAAKRALSKNLDKRIEKLHNEMVIVPGLVFPSAFSVHTVEWQVFDNGLNYEITRTLQFGGRPDTGFPFRPAQTPFITSTVKCDVTFIEEFELEQYPFDIQDLTLFIALKDKSMQILPQLNEGAFSTLATECSAVGDYAIVNYIVEFGRDAFTPSGQSDARQRYNGVSVRLKAKRQWKAIILNKAFVMFCLCLLSLLAFTMDIEDANDRMEYVLTLILTAVASELKTRVSSNITLLDHYMFASYTYLSSIMFQAAICRYITEYWDHALFYVFLGLLVIYHCGFAGYMYQTLQQEHKKINYGTRRSRQLYAKREQFSCRWTNLDKNTAGDRFMFVNSKRRLADERHDPKAVLLDYLDGNLDLYDLWNAFNVNDDDKLDDKEFDTLCADAIDVFKNIENPQAKSVPYEEKKRHVQDLREQFDIHKDVSFDKFKTYTAVYLKQQYENLWRGINMNNLPKSIDFASEQDSDNNLRTPIAGGSLRGITPASASRNDKLKRLASW